jgi:hypothetical protein
MYQRYFWSKSLSGIRFFTCKVITHTDEKDEIKLITISSTSTLLKNKTMKIFIKLFGGSRFLLMGMYNQVKEKMFS